MKNINKYNYESLEKEKEYKNNNPNEYINLYEHIIKNCSINTAAIYGIIENTGIYSPTELSNIVGLSRETVSKHIDILKQAGYLKNESMCQMELYEILKNSDKPYICEWCNHKVPIIEKHHYPIPDRQGGTETVDICPTCHKAFHKIELSINGGWDNE